MDKKIQEWHVIFFKIKNAITKINIKQKIFGHKM